MCIRDRSNILRLEVTSSIVKFELVKLTSLSNIDRESLIEPSDFSAIISNELLSNFIFFSLHSYIRFCVAFVNRLMLAELMLSQGIIHDSKIRVDQSRNIRQA